MNFKNEKIDDDKIKRLGVDNYLRTWTVDRTAEQPVYFFQTNESRRFEDCDFTICKYLLVIDDELINIKSTNYFRDDEHSNTKANTIIVESIGLPNNSAVDEKEVYDIFKQAMTIHRATASLDGLPGDYTFELKA